MRKSILIILFALLGVLSARAYDFEVDGIYYNFISGTDRVVVTSSGTEDYKYSGSMDIPATVEYGGSIYSVTAIGEKAFYNCSGLTSVTIPNSVISIGNEAFYGCTGLTSVTIPEDVTSIGIEAFRGCSGLTSVTIPNSVDTIGSLAFFGTSISSPLYNSKIFAFLPRNYSGAYTIPDGVQSIAGDAFHKCSGLTSVTIPESVTSIEHNAFYGCSGLTSVTIPESVTAIGDNAFYNCSGLTSVTSLAETPPSCEEETFGDDDYYTIPLYVPAGSKPFYAAAQGWRKFAKIEPNTYMVTVRPNDASMGTVVGGGKYVKVEQALLAAIPNKGYYFDRWDDGNTDNPRILTVSGDTTITAVFAKYGDAADFYTVTVHPNNASMGSVTGGGKYAFGEQTTLEAIPNQGYHFVKWDDGNPRVLTVTEDITLTAIFAKDGENSEDPDAPTPNEAVEADNFRVYVQDRTILLSENVGAVQVYNMAGQCVYNGHATSIPVPQSGVYIVAVGSQRFKVLVR